MLRPIIDLYSRQAMQKLENSLYLPNQKPNKAKVVLVAKVA